MESDKERAIARRNRFKYEGYYSPLEDKTAHDYFSMNKDGNFIDVPNVSGFTAAEANYNAIMEQAEKEEVLYKYVWDTYSDQIFINVNLPEDSDIWGMVCSLTEYHLLNEDASSKLELEAQNNAWESYVRCDLERAIVKIMEYETIHDDECEKNYKEVDELTKKAEKITLDIKALINEQDLQSVNEIPQDRYSEYVTAWEVKSDRLRKAAHYCTYHCEADIRKFETASSDVMWSLFCDLQEKANIYWVEEPSYDNQSNWYIDVAALVKEFTKEDLQKVFRNIDEEVAAENNLWEENLYEK